ncbi:unnamed protein product [Lupinus luteus]|uniref:RNase H type-1 domain-containing protein n=1 Tax=Lupinus luteus TaxID=3873 RepID=A0AAV1WTT2_LUPLU
MPTDEHLESRGIIVVSMCSLYKSSVETSNHIFLNCSFAMDMWNWIGFMFNTSISTQSTFSIMLVCDQSNSPQVNLLLGAGIINIVHIIWYCHNKSRFDNINLSTRHAISRIKVSVSLSGNTTKLCANASMNDFILLRRFQVSINYNKAPRVIEVIWSFPSPSWIKINTSMATHGSPGHAGGGGIFRDNSRLMLGCFAAYFGLQDSIFVELLAALMAIEIAHSKGWFNIWLECDSTIVVAIFNGKVNVPWKQFKNWNHCRLLI